jgi:hypothetical protein
MGDFLQGGRTYRKDHMVHVFFVHHVYVFKFPCFLNNCGVNLGSKCTSQP